MHRGLFSSLLFLLIGFLLISAAATAQTAVPPKDASASALRDVQVDAGKVTGSIRSFQGLNGPPFPIMEGLPSLLQQYQALHVDTVRTHDTVGPIVFAP